MAYPSAALLPFPHTMAKGALHSSRWETTASAALKMSSCEDMPLLKACCSVSLMSDKVDINCTLFTPLLSLLIILSKEHTGVKRRTGKDLKMIEETD